MSDALPPVTVCRPCGTTENCTLIEHLEARHVNQVLDVRVDPEANTATIHSLAGGYTALYAVPSWPA